MLASCSYHAPGPRCGGPAAHRSRVLCAVGKLVLYTKADCPLCDGLKDKVSGLIARAQFMPSLLSSYELEVRDIGTSAEWTAAYQYEVPVLAAEEEDGRMAVLPRPTPRISADRLQKNIEAALTALGAQQ